MAERAQAPERCTAVITGASGAIGAAIARLLAAAGHHVIAAGRSRESLETVARDVVGDVDVLVCDVGDEAMVADTIGRLDAVDILVNNAGAATSNPVHRTSMAQWESMLRVNATGPFLCTRAVLPGMRRRGWGRVVTVASVAGHTGSPYIAAYTASKHAAVGLMRVVAAEVRGTGVTANAVCPSYVRSAMTVATIDGIAGRAGRTAVEAEAMLVDTMVLGRLVEPEEVAAAVGYLASDLAAAVNGQSIVLDGGALQL